MKRKKWFTGTVFFTVFLIISLITGCGKQVKPEDHFNTYISAWMKMDYAGMYDQLSVESKKAITKDQFVKRYDDIYKGVEAGELNVSFDPPKQGKDTKNEAEITYHVKMTTMAGPISFDHQAKLIKEDIDKQTRWDVIWDPSLIFPQLAQGDKVKVQVTKAPRGEIKDRNGVGLAINGTATVVGVVPGQLGNEAEQSKQKLATMLNISLDEINKDLQASWIKPDSFVPIETVSDQQAAPFQGQGIKGIATRKTTVRQYPLGEAAAHLTGYVGPINAQELEKKKDNGYRAGDLIGKAGLEQVFETQLRGKNGVRIYTEDASGKDKQNIAKVDAFPGQTITTTIDAKVQQTVFEQIKPDAGTAAAIQPTSGDILALVSSPSYDPNQMILGVSKTQWDQWNNDPQKPLLNRFTQAYVPGSSFKVITAAIGLNTHTLDPTKERNITGLQWMKDNSWGNYYVKRVHDVDRVNLQKALVYSDNIYFAQTALDIGKDNFTKGAAAFGIGEKLPLPYPFETAKLANNEIKSEIQLADTGYGQGEVAMTALQLALSYTPIVNAGNIPYPSLTVSGEEHPKTWKENVMSQDTINEIKNDLIQAVGSPDGTGHKAALPNMTIAGKTGTAELKKAKGEDGVEYGWFVGFNADQPQFLISMMVEDVKNRGGSGYVASKIKNIFQTTIH